MDAKQLHEEEGQKTFALIFDTGDEVMAGLTGFAKENGLDAASLRARNPRLVYCSAVGFGRCA